MNAVLKTPAAQDHKVRDMSLADLGRKRIRVGAQSVRRPNGSA